MTPSVNSTKPSFAGEIMNVLHAVDGNPITTCMQCGTCSGTCPAAGFMDHTPRRLIAMINAGLKERVMSSNTCWYCASCYQCTVRCPRGIDIAELMYGLKRYSIWRKQHPEGLIGPVFSETFVKTILRSGRSYEPVLATSYLFTYGVQDFIQEAFTATELMLKGRIPLLPPRIKRLENFKRMIRRIVPIADA
ncbi:MAG: 4Fe-4S dicluster domain-containing protein [Verrucomicrobia bacterium]|nr:4Fe-4S dicluster domain-containing protein [Verrucomicrobiota bacterium]